MAAATAMAMATATVMAVAMAAAVAVAIAMAMAMAMAMATAMAAVIKGDCVRWALMVINFFSLDNRMKIVLNKCFGGFSVSLEAARFMAARGNEQAIAEVAEYDSKLSDPTKQRDLEKKYGVKFLGSGKTGDHGGYERNNVDLASAVEALGKKASGADADLRIIEIPDGVGYEIDEYDGMESIHEQHRSWRR